MHKQGDFRMTKANFEKLLVVLLIVTVVFVLTACTNESISANKVSGGAPVAFSSNNPNEDAVKMLAHNNTEEKLIALGYTQNQSLAICSTLVGIGIESIKVVVADDETEDGMRVIVVYFNDTTRSGFVSTVFGETAVVGVESPSGEVEILYDTEQGGLLTTWNEFENTINVTYDQQIVLMTMCEDVAKMIAQNPATVDFKTFMWEFGRDEQDYSVQGVFTCSNLFGVTEEHTLRVDAKANDDYSIIQPHTIYLDNVMVHNEN
jgi:hypothetical protein